MGLVRILVGLVWTLIEIDKIPTGFLKICIGLGSILTGLVRIINRTCRIC